MSKKVVRYIKLYIFQGILHIRQKGESKNETLTPPKDSPLKNTSYTLPKKRLILRKFSQKTQNLRKRRKIYAKDAKITQSTIASYTQAVRGEPLELARKGEKSVCLRTPDLTPFSEFQNSFSFWKF
jgi:hypothetical protein